MAAKGGIPARQADPLTGVKTINAEIFAMTYGAFVRFTIEQARAGCPDSSWAQGVNATLHAMGARMGERLVDEFFIRDADMRDRAQQAGPAQMCASLRQVVDTLARRALPMFLGMADGDIKVVEALPDDGAPPRTTAFDLVFQRESPLSMFVELPKQLRDARIWYSNVLCGAIEGAVRMLEYPVGGVKACFKADRLVTPDQETRIRVQHTPPDEKRQ